jgi:hypothetical protein
MGWLVLVRKLRKFHPRYLREKVFQLDLMLCEFYQHPSGQGVGDCLYTWMALQLLYHMARQVRVAV